MVEAAARPLVHAMAFGVTSGVARYAFYDTPPSGTAHDHSADEVMHSIIAQHLLASEIGLLETTLARRSSSPSAASRIMHNEVSAVQSQTQADCRHLEVTLQAARCEHTAADTALQTALQASEQLLRSAVSDLFIAQEALVYLNPSRPGAAATSLTLPVSQPPLSPPAHSLVDGQSPPRLPTLRAGQGSSTALAAATLPEVRGRLLSASLGR